MSMDTPQNEVIIEEELTQNYNPEDEDIVFIDDDSENDSNCDIYYSYQKEKNFFSFKAFRTLKFSDYKRFWTLIFSDIFFVRKFFCMKFFALNVDFFSVQGNPQFLNIHWLYFFP